MSDEPAFPLPTSKSPWPAALIGAAVHAGLWVLLFAGLGSVLSEQKRLFDELAIQIPQGTKLALTFGRILTAEPIVAVLGLSVILSVDLFLLYRLGRGGYRVLRELWSGLMVAVPVFMFTMVAGSVALAHHKLTYALTRTPANYAKGERAEVERLAGKWKLIAVERDGQPAEAPATTLLFKDRSFRWETDNGWRGGSFYPHLTRNPIGITMWYGDAGGGQEIGANRHGLYKFASDRLILCLGEPDALGETLPADFTTRGTKNELFTFEREK